MRSQHFTHILAGAAIALLLPQLFSCTLKEKETLSNETFLNSFRAEIAEDYVPEGLKSTVDISAGTTTFVNNDAVFVTDGTNEATYTTTGGASGTATFTKASGDVPSSFKTATVFFPASMKESREGNVLTLNLDWATQDCLGATELSNLPMYGRFNSDGTTCRFYNLCTILKISAKDGSATPDSGLQSVVFTSHEVGVTGTATFSEGKLVIASDAGKTITLNHNSALGSPSPSVWYLKVPAQTYTGGFELKMTFSSGKTYTYSTNKTVILQPGYISAMEAFACKYFSGGSGSAANPYRIATSDDVKELTDRIAQRNAYKDSSITDLFRNKHYVMTNNINMGNAYIGVIGTETSQYFTGTFDGQGYTLSNVNISRPSYDRCALFGCLDGGTIRRLKVSNAYVPSGRSGNYSAILAARAINGALIEDCTVENSNVLSSGTAVGVLAGELDASVIRNCTVSGIEVTGTNPGSHLYGVGGLVGAIKGSSPSSLSNCSCLDATVTLTSDNHCGGIVGYCPYQSYSTIEGCTFSGVVTSTGGNTIGGIIGDIGGNIIVRDCHVVPKSNGDPSSVIGYTGQNYAGGIVGYVSARDVNAREAEVSSCSFTGVVEVKNMRAGGIVANSEVPITIKNCTVENAEISGYQQVGGIVARTTANAHISGCKVLSSTITASGQYGVGGIVGYMRDGGGEVSDCYTENTDVESTSTDSNDAGAGGIVGEIRYPGTNPDRILRCYTTGGSVTANNNRVGGIIGVINGQSLVDACWSDENVSSASSSYGGHDGGIVGAIASGTSNVLVINCSYLGGTVEDGGINNGGVAGIVGSMYNPIGDGSLLTGYVVNCYAKPTALSTNQYAAGGIVGYLTRNTVDNCFSPMPETAVTISYAGESKYLGSKGGVIGLMRRGGRVVNCYGSFQGSYSRDTETDKATIQEDTWKITTLSDAKMKASSASVTIPSTGTTAASLTDALNQGVSYYNNGGDGVAHHGTLPHGVRAVAWVKSSSTGAGQGYPVLTCSPLCDADPESYARAVTYDDLNLTIFFPAKSDFNGKLVILLPGGTYNTLRSASGDEGEGWASYYNDLGIACGVLRYTLPGGNSALPIADVENAIKYVRDHSAALHVNSIGLHGFGAGGHLASTIATHYTAATRPDFQILFYPLITMGSGTEATAKTNFLGTSPSDEMVALYSNASQVTSDTPPAFVMYYASETTVSPASNGAAYVTALGAKATAKVFSGSTHGWNNSDKLNNKTVRQHLSDWLENL